MALAAALGPSFDAATLATIAAGARDRVVDDLAAACHESVLVKRGERFEFVHDQVRESAYRLLPEAERPAVHLAIGRRLAEEERERLFDVVHHLGRALALLSEPSERAEAARFHLEAGRKAAAGAAFPAAFDREVVREVLELLAGRGARVVIAPDLPTVRGDRQRLGELYQNLIDNALKFTRDMEAPRVEVGGADRDGERVLWVRDNGLGIDPRYHDRFDLGTVAGRLQRT